MDCAAMARPLDSAICKCRLGLGCVRELQFVQADAVAVPHNRKHFYGRVSDDM